MPSIKVSLSIGLANCSQEDVIDICEHEWFACNGDNEKQEELMHEYWTDWANNYIDGGAFLADE